MPRREEGRERSAEPAGVGDVLDAVLAGRRWRSGLLLGRLTRAWESVVGERLARETSPARLEEAGTLVVRASSAAWAAQVRFLSAELAARANGVLGARAVRDVRVMVAPEGRSPERVAEARDRGAGRPLDGNTDGII